ncbi:hypothetical protein BN1088_1431205 [Sphingobacterium sp. PM2-P1-29]|nr:hypothetical protein BN1088_1431205 [Sphingobacterium sp. PM2-P1-29]
MKKLLVHQEKGKCYGQQKFNREERAYLIFFWSKWGYRPFYPITTNDKGIIFL